MTVKKKVVKKKVTPRRKVGRPQKTLTDEQMIQLEALSEALNQDQIADYFGICRKTFYEMMERDPLISTRYQKGRAKTIAGVGGNLISQARNGNTAAAIFYLKTQAGWREEKEPEKEQDSIADALNNLANKLPD